MPKENRNFSSSEDLEYIRIINKDLKEYEKKLESIFKEKNYANVITDGMKICELMLELLLKKEGHPTIKSSTIIRYGMGTEFIPNKYKTTLLKIEKIKDKVGPENNVNYSNTYTFLKSFQKLIVWFNNYNMDKYSSPSFNINNCIDLIQLLPANEPSDSRKLIIKKKNDTDEHDPNKDILKINETIENLEKHLELICEENYAGSIIEGHKLCVLMVELFLKNEGYTVNDGSVILNDEKIPPITFCNQENLLPKECLEFLNIIKEYKKEFLNPNSSYDFALSFLKTLSYFLVWFNNFYSKKYHVEKPFNIKNCYMLIDSLSNSKNEKEQILKSFSLEFKRQKAILPGQIDLNPSLNPNTVLKSSDDFLLGLILNGVIGLQKGQGTIISTLNDIKQEIKNISMHITDYQSLMEKLIKNAESESEKDRLRAAFTDECSERIIEKTENFKDSSDYELIKEDLTEKFGAEAWGKLSEKSKTFLISSKLMFNNLKDMEEIVDYSGVCILVTKALEVELYDRFLINFLRYLDNKYNENCYYKDYTMYPTGLMYKNKGPLRDYQFSLGKVAYILCLKPDYYTPYKENNKKQLIEYCKNDLFKTSDVNKIKEDIDKYAKDIEEIKDNYRNPSAHINKIEKTDAKDCLDLVVDVQKLLKKMLESFNN